MNNYALETNSLSHSFTKKEMVLKDINLKIPEASIFGFLGPNGAGKTTTLKLVLGLLKLQQGSISIFGKPFEKNRVEILRRTGSLIENPSVYSQLTAKENLEVFRKIYRCSPQRIAEVLKLVELENTNTKKAGQFSLGMKQRLGIAIALLNRPSLLILDEPTNGLDPNGMIGIRELLKKLNQENGTTILVSSHLLTEIEKLVTHTAIIQRGQIRFQGRLEDLLNKQAHSSRLMLDTSNSSATLELLSASGIHAVLEKGKILMPLVSRERSAEIARLVIGAGIDLYEFTSNHEDLESIFMNLINE
jgi:ABC-type multidrug transport system ATPase subunit